MIRMVVFDMAGTTVNEDNIVYKTLQKAISEKGYDFSLDKVLAQGAGKEKLEAIKSILAAYAQNHDEILAGEIYGRFMVMLEEAYGTHKVFPQQNADQLFQSLREKNILVVLNTGYSNETAVSLIEKIGWKEGEDFDGLITATDVQNNRPNPDMILLAMQKFNIADAEEVVKVGDSIIDIEEGRNAGCSMNIGITTGAHTYDQLLTANPDYIIDDLLDLLPILEMNIEMQM
ncbi:HAD-IA family hydrolase [Pinibacter soli]|uniref:HAD-IA family hydrolase n=1 Tax=Pinibacter soli TaxID=3044211 RepID=A0ABT6RF82_9BACT|nr:HAD-IA family hydrolase [Pinibacter soli]MDI3321232.1 HAD-IA family hydrolase [Pinibacter soli]